MIKIEIQAESVVEAVAMLRDFVMGHEAQVTGAGTPPLIQSADKVRDEVEAGLPAAQVSVPAAAHSDVAAPKRRGRPLKSAAPGVPEMLPVLPSESGAQAPEDAPTSALAFDDVKARLQEVAALSSGKGLREATAIINEFGYAMTKEIQPKDFGAIVARCDELLAA